MSYEPVIGFEIHVELSTVSKMFCGCSADWFGKEPNTQTCPVCLGLPGALPAPNKKAIEWTVLLGLALGCEIPLTAKFDRKHYFYPDLPKGYQISQYDEPFARNGALKSKVKSQKSKVKQEKIIRIRRIHLEEDTAKLMHQFGNPSVKKNAVGTFVDFNRSGVPLVEVVTEPDIHSAEEAVIFLKKLRQIIRYVQISDCNMEKGSMRLEPNISLREVKSQTSNVKSELPDYKVEVKNINSFRFAARAIACEIERQAALLDQGKTPVQETRGFNERKGVTVSQRVKEEAHDYRYFPEPDIPPIRFAKSQITNYKLQIPELPDKKYHRFRAEYKLPEQYARQLTQDKEVADFFETAVTVGGRLEKPITTKEIANRMVNKKFSIDERTPQQLVEQIRKETHIESVDQSALEKAVQAVIARNEKAVTDYKNGKEQSIMYLVGQVMRAVNGKADAQSVRQLLIEKMMVCF